MAKNRSKRLRKKLHLGEFEQLGFKVSFTQNKAKDEKTKDVYINRFLVEAIEAQGVFFAGSIGEITNGFVYVQSSSATQAHRQHVEDWLLKQADIVNREVGCLINAWQ